MIKIAPSILSGLACLAITTITPADASPVSPNYNYIFPDGSSGFALTSQGGPINPGVLVGFNPQPDPPAIPPPTTLSLSNPANPILVSPGPCDVACPATAYNFVMSFQGIGNPTLGTPAVPNSDGNTSLSFTAGLHQFELFLKVNGPTSIIDWVAFNPQPDPPADWFAVQVTFAGDPQASFSLVEDGQQLSFQLARTPVPATLPLFASGLGVIGLLARRRRKQPA
jgi:hypothetical protein